MTDVEVSLGSFIDFTNALGASRARLTMDVRDRYEDPDRKAWLFYRDFNLALRGGLLAGDLAGYLARSLAAVDPRKRKHYEALSVGALNLLRKTGPVTLVPSVVGPWVHDNVTINVRPHVTVELRSGEVQSWYLYHKDPLLTQRAAALPVFISGQVLEAASSAHTPCVVDVRRAKVHKASSRTNQRHLKAGVIAETEAFARYWELVAVA